MDAELKANLTDLDKVIAHNRQTLARVDLLAVGLKGLVDKPEPRRVKALFDEHLASVGIDLPGLRRDAWEAALADQAVMQLPRQTLLRYSEAYTAQRDGLQSVQATFQALGTNMVRLFDEVMDAEFERVDALQALKAVSGYRLLLRSTLSGELELRQQLAEARERPSAEPAGTAVSAR